MNPAERIIRAVDRAQRQRPWLAFAVAVWKKFGDDQAGNLAALVAYYTFASLFPLLLVFVTVLDLVLKGDPALRNQLLNSAFGQFPVIGPELRKNINSLNQTGVALAIGLILTFLGARGVANAMMNALNTVWEVPLARRPGFPWDQLRGIGLILVVGIGIVTTSTLSGLAAGASVLPGPVAAAGAIAVSFILNVGVFWLAFRLATVRDVGTRELFLGALLSAAMWQVLQTLGTWIVSHQLAHASSLYGVFGLVLGLIAWLFLEAQFTLYAVEVSVVRSHRLWPRSLAPPPLTGPDRKALALYARSQQRRPEEDIDVAIPEDGGQRDHPDHP
ncbi:MAG: YihY/virulence factor BrkB family protein [Gemmatimonadota bacterium]